MALNFIKRLFGSIKAKIAAVFTKTKADELIFEALAEVWDQYDDKIYAVLAQLWKVNNKAGLHEWRDQAFSVLKAELPNVDNALLAAAINLGYRKLTQIGTK